MENKRRRGTTTRGSVEMEEGVAEELAFVCPPWPRRPALPVPCSSRSRSCLCHHLVALLKEGGIW